MHPLLRRIVFYRPLQVIAGLLVVYALLGFLVLPIVIERAVPNYVRDTLHRRASVADVDINPFLLSLSADNVRLDESNGALLVGVRRLFVNFDLSGVFHRTWTFSAIRIEGMEVHVERGTKGEFNFAQLIDSFPRGPTPSPKANAETVRWSLAHVEVVDGRVFYRDRAGKTPARISIAPLNLDIQNLSTLHEQRAALALNATLLGGGTLAARAALVMRPFAVTGRVSCRDFPLASAWPFLRDHLRLAEPKGKLDVASAFHTTRDNNASFLTLSDARVQASALDVRESDANTPLFAAASVAASGGVIDFGKHTATIPQITLSNGQVGLRVAKDGAVNWARLAPASAPSAQAPVATPWRVSLDSVQFVNIAAHVLDLSHATPVSLTLGQLDAVLKLDVVTDKVTTLRADATNIDIAKLSLQAPADASPALTLGKLNLQSGTLDTRARRIAITQVNLRDGAMRLVRNAQGRLSLLDILSDGKPASAAPAPWFFRLATLQVQNAKASLVDETYQPALAVAIDELGATLKALSNDNTTTMQFDASAHMESGGHVSASGTMTGDRSHVQAKVIADRLDLAPLQTLIAQHTTLSLKNGAASAATEVEYTSTPGADAVVQVNGTGSIDDLLLNETRSKDKFFASHSVAANGIHYRSAPGQLLIDDVRVIEPDAKVVVFPDRTLNLIKAFKKNAVDKNAIAQTAQQKAASQRFPIKLVRIRVERGKVDYDDQSLVLPFSTKVNDFHGTVTGIASDPDSRAKIHLEGRIEQYGSAKVSGTLSPFAPKHFMDIRTVFTNVEMPKLSPYSATFAGREIATGKLTLDLRYKINDGVLAGDNLVLLDHFTLGKVVASKDALDLPLDLAVALLTDARGHIDITVPVTGDLTKPNFAMGKVIGAAIAQVLTKIVTAPFRALGALLGGGDKQRFDAIVFGPGSVQLDPPQLEQIKQLADALAKRPQLKLIVQGRYDPKRDGAALRAEQVRRAVSTELNISLTAEERAAPVAFDDAKSQRALEVLYAKRAGDNAVANLQTQYEKKSGKPVERVNPILALFSKPSPDAEFYKAMYKDLVQLQPLAVAALHALATQRGEDIVRALVHEEHVAAERVATAAPKAVDKPAKSGVETTLSLSVAK